MAQIFRINLKTAHEKTGLTYYAVAKKTGLAQNTVRKYAENEVVSPYLPTAVVVLAAFYGLDWRDPAVVEIVESSEDPEMQTALLSPVS
jgi:transcriptional regulator with XRE-family HTH domain